MNYGQDYDHESNAAFNQGADARIRGGSRLANPYSAVYERNAWKYWRAGYDHAHSQFGNDVRGRWIFVPLPRTGLLAINNLAPNPMTENELEPV